MREVLVQVRRLRAEVKHQRNERLHGSRRRVATNECIPRSVLSVPVAAASSSTLRGLPLVDNGGDSKCDRASESSVLRGLKAVSHGVPL